MPKAKQISHPKQLSHFDNSGQARMVDVSAKLPTRRTATASAFVELSAGVLAALPSNPKGDPLQVARIAGIQAAKRTCGADSHVPSAAAHARRRAGGD